LIGAEKTLLLGLLRRTASKATKVASRLLYRLGRKQAGGEARRLLLL